MQIDKNDKFTLISIDENSFSEFYNSFLIEEKNRQKENIVIQVSNNINISSKEFLLFLDISEQKKENGTSFVVISSEINIDNFPDSFNIVPTLQEAEDVIDMEDMERELGF
ncbi:hypothetical protein [Polaribacter aquimarinus]|uniref:Uncharacterized protein n=1 Tax=Polaribacter aquimarinus TaxID=2100726 RepID=A0A2U2JDK3_9FLAO|nr:hypothetical protein [Polaribacter aquimarinus]PWG06394.1 hypothetical protein DIS07_00760 [Polaribacter aquimarinus]